MEFLGNSREVNNYMHWESSIHSSMEEIAMLLLNNGFSIFIEFSVSHGIHSLSSILNKGWSCNHNHSFFFDIEEEIKEIHSNTFPNFSNIFLIPNSQVLDHSICNRTDDIGSKDAESSWARELFITRDSSIIHFLFTFTRSVSNAFTISNVTYKYINASICSGVTHVSKDGRILSVKDKVNHTLIHIFERQYTNLRSSHEYKYFGSASTEKEMTSQLIIDLQFYYFLFSNERGDSLFLLNKELQVPAVHPHFRFQSFYLNPIPMYIDKCIISYHLLNLPFRSINISHTVKVMFHYLIT